MCDRSVECSQLDASFLEHPLQAIYEYEYRQEVAQSRKEVEVSLVTERCELARHGHSSAKPLENVSTFKKKNKNHILYRAIK